MLKGASFGNGWELQEASFHIFDLDIKSWIFLIAASCSHHVPRIGDIDSLVFILLGQARHLKIESGTVARNPT